MSDRSGQHSTAQHTQHSIAQHSTHGYLLRRGEAEGPLGSSNVTCSPGGTKKLENSLSNTNWDIGISKLEIIDLDI